MTKRKNLSKADRFQMLEKKVEQLQMATRVSQAFLQQVANNSGGMSRDMGELSTRQRETNYRLLALEQLAGVKNAEVLALAESLQIKDFDEASAREDKEGNYTVEETVGEDSAIIITSKIVGQTGGILRSRLKMSEIGFPQLRTDLLGKKVGDVVPADINGTKHEITILGVRLAPKQEEVPADVTNTQQSEPANLPN